MTDLEKLFSIRALFVDEYKEFILSDGGKILLNDLTIGGHAMAINEKLDRVNLGRGIYNLMGNVQITIGENGKIVSMMINNQRIPSIKRSDKIDAFLTSVKLGHFNKP